MRAIQVALYARVSGDQQTHAGTIASQVANLRDRIVADGGRLEPEHAFSTRATVAPACSALPWRGCATPRQPA